MVDHKMALLNRLWKRNIKAEMLYNTKPKPQKQLGYALQNQIPFIIWMGQDEIDAGQFKIKVLFVCLALEHVPGRRRAGEGGVH